jgi:hypothetical protein
MTAAATVDVESRSRLAQRAGIAVLVCIAVSVAILFSGINRPIWIDEFLHFAFGGFGSTQDAWRAIVRSLEDVNHNQTGVYMLVDYWLLKVFGASAIWLRMPSSIGVLVLFSGAVCVLRTRGFGYAWQVAVVLLLVAQRRMLMHFVAEARPYMLLAATCVGVLAYYGAGVHRRHWFICMLGWLSALVGAAMHPYFLPYYIFVVGLTYADRISWDLRRIAPKDIWQHLQPAMLCATLAIYFGVGMLTWMPRQPQLALDPFHFIPRNALLLNVIFYHFEFLLGTERLRIAMLLVLAALGAGAAILALLHRGGRWRAGEGSAWHGHQQHREQQCRNRSLFSCLARSNCRSLLSPLALIFVALLLSGLLSLMSYRAHYWILPRQWVASIALACVGTVWLCAAGAELLPTWARRRAGIAVAIFAVFPAEEAVVVQFRTIDSWRAAQSTIARNAGHVSLSPYSSLPVEPRRITIDQLKSSDGDVQNAAWTALANQNVLVGGPVWPIFQRYYGRQ